MATWVTPSPCRWFPALLPAFSQTPPCWGYLRHFPMSSPNTAGFAQRQEVWRSSVSRRRSNMWGRSTATPTQRTTRNPIISKCLLAPLFTKDFARFRYLTAPSGSPMTLCFCQRKSAHRVTPSISRIGHPTFGDGNSASTITQREIDSGTDSAAGLSESHRAEPSRPLPTAHLSERSLEDVLHIGNLFAIMNGISKGGYVRLTIPESSSNHLARGRVCDGKAFGIPHSRARSTAVRAIEVMGIPSTSTIRLAAIHATYGEALTRE